MVWYLRTIGILNLEVQNFRYDELFDSIEFKSYKLYQIKELDYLAVLN